MHAYIIYVNNFQDVEEWMLKCLPVVIIADLIAAGLHEGYSVFRRPTTPATWGHDIEVPDSKLNETILLSKALADGPVASVKAAITFTPGADISGWNSGKKNITEWLNTNQGVEGASFDWKTNLKNFWVNSVRAYWWESCYNWSWLHPQQCDWMSNVSHRIPTYHTLLSYYLIIPDYIYR